MLQHSANYVCLLAAIPVSAVTSRVPAAAGHCLPCTLVSRLAHAAAYLLLPRVSVAVARRQTHWHNATLHSQPQISGPKADD
jgi:hypothetical protein